MKLPLSTATTRRFSGFADRISWASSVLRLAIAASSKRVRTRRSGCSSDVSPELVLLAGRARRRDRRSVLAPEGRRETPDRGRRVAGPSAVVAPDRRDHRIRDRLGRGRAAEIGGVQGGVGGDPRPRASAGRRRASRPDAPASGRRSRRCRPGWRCPCRRCRRPSRGRLEHRGKPALRVDVGGGAMPSDPARAPRGPTGCRRAGWSPRSCRGSGASWSCAWSWRRPASCPRSRPEIPRHLGGDLVPHHMAWRWRSTWSPR